MANSIIERSTNYNPYTEVNVKKWMGLIVGAAALLSSSLAAEEAAPELVAAAEQAPKQVGKASVDSVNTAKNNNIAKYTLAAGAVAIGITALILVSRHHGHHHHHSHNN